MTLLYTKTACYINTDVYVNEKIEDLKSDLIDLNMETGEIRNITHKKI